jgi:hypothetical protein
MKRTDANPSASLTRLLACAAAISCAATLAGVFSTGCSLDPSGVSSEVPAASILTLPASSTTQREFGVVKWNLDLGQEGLVVTGYDSSGNAVRGLLLAFTAPQPPTQMMVEMLDGTLMAQVLSFGADGAASVAGYLTENQERFVGQALVDIATYESEQAETLGTSSVEQGSAHSGGGGGFARSTWSVVFSRSTRPRRVRPVAGSSTRTTLRTSPWAAWPAQPARPASTIRPPIT